MQQNSYQACELLSGAFLSLLLCIFCWIPHQTPMSSMGALPSVMWKHSWCWNRRSVALQAHCGQWHSTHKGNVKRKNQWLLRLIQCVTAYYYVYVYILFICSKVVHLVSQPDQEVKPQLKCSSSKYSQGHILVSKVNFFFQSRKF